MKTNAERRADQARRKILRPGPDDPRFAPYPIIIAGSELYETLVFETCKSTSKQRGQLPGERTNPDEPHTPSENDL